MAKISVIVPIYNAQSTLVKMLESLIQQTFKDLEILLIDDGSTDLSGKICDNYQKKDKRIKVIHQNNQGVSMARNKGLEMATGDFIGFVDSDDLIAKEMYEILYKNIIKTKADISVCSYIKYSKEPVFTYQKEIVTLNKVEALKSLVSDGIVNSFLWNKLFKKELFRNILFPENRIYEDLYVMPLIIDKVNKIVYSKSKLYGYYQRNDSYVNTYNDNKNKNFLEYSNRLYQELLKYESLKENLKEYQNLFIYTAYLQAAKSKCYSIFQAKYMDKYYKIYKENYSLKNNYSIKRKILTLGLYLNKKLFYKIVQIKK